ncbi:MAG: single-stranded DNA-binding protein [Simkaniaceae bacterium]|nr:single-stranded DNA-binding protein [Simkaniaceae bacterium]
MNHIMIAGHLGNDPEVRFTSGGAKVTAFRVAGNVRRGGKDETIWWRVTVWGEQFDKMISYLKKGSPVIVHGELSKPEIFKDKEGNPQVSLNVTAQTLSFSPFGRGDRNQEGGSTNQNFSRAPVQSHHQETNHGNTSDMNYSYYDQPEQGQGQQDMAHTFSDDDIPF